MAIYKPSLLDKFIDFVNGLKSNWDEYEAHVAEFEAHLADYTNNAVKKDEIRTVVLSGCGKPNWSKLGRSNNITNAEYYFTPQLPAGAVIKKITCKFASDRTVTYHLELYKEGSLLPSGSASVIDDITSNNPNAILELTPNYVIEEEYGVALRINVTSSGGTYTYVYPPMIDIEIG